MGIESPLHLLFIGIVALVVLGPKRLPELARAVGKGVREFRGAIEEGQQDGPPDGPAPHAEPANGVQEPAGAHAPHELAEGGAPAGEVTPVPSLEERLGG